VQELLPQQGKKIEESFKMRSFGQRSLRQRAMQELLSSFLPYQKENEEDECQYQGLCFLNQYQRKLQSFHPAGDGNYFIKHSIKEISKPCGGLPLRILKFIANNSIK
jgi:hypothetical protein